MKYCCGEKAASTAVRKGEDSKKTKGFKVKEGKNRGI